MAAGLLGGASRCWKPRASREPARPTRQPPRALREWGRAPRLLRDSSHTRPEKSSSSTECLARNPRHRLSSPTASSTSTRRSSSPAAGSSTSPLQQHTGSSSSQSRPPEPPPPDCARARKPLRKKKAQPRLKRGLRACSRTGAHPSPPASTEQPAASSAPAPHSGRHRSPGGSGLRGVTQLRT
ncbi:hypothetical protein GDO81_028058 [Engystomops pustulosus]|uniref:Uncharacterized protein n=1 Tax=Engystomops pustulosus TaxID=76066 RepID=A0AAV6YX13_ENGPU|nr:hypothetical protein GDO81_028058 [Engystomops pustulosus]